MNTHYQKILRVCRIECHLCAIPNFMTKYFIKSQIRENVQWPYVAPIMNLNCDANATLSHS